MEKHDVQLTYFKTYGKYYTQATVTVECASYDIPKTVAKMLADGNWPGLTDAPWHHFDVLIDTCPGNVDLPAITLTTLFRLFYGMKELWKLHTS